MLPQSNRLERFWPAVLGLFSALSLAGLVALARLPADPEKALALGFSASRLALMAALLDLALAWAGLALATWRPPRWAVPWFEIARHPGLQDAALLASPLLALAAQALLAILWGLSQHGVNYRYLAYAQRLQPLLDVLSLTGLLLFTWLALLRRASLKTALAASPLGGGLAKGRLAAAIVWLVFGALAIFVAVTRIGVTPEATGSWGEPAVPFLEWQVLLAWLLASLLLLAETQTPAFFAPKHIDLIIGLAIWLGTAGLWLSQPVQPAYFATPPRPPNYEIYPYSDGLTYDQYAQSILIGNGLMGNDIPARPLYIVFLAGLHALAGQDYTRVIALQSLVLAVFPLSLYLLGKELGSRPLGLAAAILVVLRDLTSNQVAPFTNNLTYSKLYFSELPAALLLSLLAWQAVRWMRRPLAARLAPLLAGGLLGLSMLVRTQSAIVLPVVLLAAWLAIKQPRIALRGSLLLLAGVALAVAPWLWRNWRLTGGLVFDNPASQTMVLAQRYSGLNFEDVIPYLPGETDSQYSQRMLQIALDGIRRDPAQALHTMANHFLNNEIDNVLLMPLRSDLQSLQELWQPTRAFWQDWNGQPTSGQAILLGVYLGLLGLGLAACWHKAGWAGLLPLGINLGYNLWTGLFRSSGERFLVPVDWTATIYFAAGLVTLSSGLLLLLSHTRQGMLDYFVTAQTLTPPSPAQSSGRGSQESTPAPSGGRRGSRESTPAPSGGGRASRELTSAPSSGGGGSPGSLPRRSERWGRVGVRVCAFLFPALIIFALGASLPLSEHVVPQRYPPATRQVLLAHLSAAAGLPQAGLDAPAIQALAQEPGALVLRGRAIYPRYYAAGEGEPLSAKTGYSDMPQPRLVFFLLGQTNSLVVLDLPPPQRPPFFPNAADVTLIGLPRKGYIQAKAVLVETPSKSALYLWPGKN
jgi:hypothetical protein